MKKDLQSARKCDILNKRLNMCLVGGFAMFARKAKVKTLLFCLLSSLVFAVFGWFSLPVKADNANYVYVSQTEFSFVSAYTNRKKDHYIIELSYKGVLPQCGTAYHDYQQLPTELTTDDEDVIVVDQVAENAANNSLLLYIRLYQLTLCFEQFGISITSIAC